MKLRILFLGMLVPALGGCVYSHRQPEVVYYAPVPEPATTLPPTSENPAPRVYPGSPPAPAGTVLSSDVALAHSIRDVLKNDPNLAAVSDKVLVKVEGGIVSLKGTVPTEHDRDEIAGRISRLPGVRRLNDHLGIDLQ